MRFDHFTITLLELRPDAPEMDDEAADTLQSEHLRHLAELHEEGVLIAAGPVLGPPERTLRGLSIWNLSPAEVEQRIAEHPDPAVAAGRFTQRVLPWMVPAGAIAVGSAHFPHSVQEAEED